MWGRVHRAVHHIERATGTPIQNAAVFVVYDPRLLAGVLTAGMGTAALGGPPAGVAKGISDLIEWGEQESTRYARLPHKALIAVTASRAELYAWPVATDPPPLVTLRKGTFQLKTTVHPWYGQLDLRIRVSRRKVLLLSAKCRWPRRAASRCAEALRTLACTTFPPDNNDPSHGTL